MVARSATLIRSILMQFKSPASRGDFILGGLGAQEPDMQPWSLSISAQRIFWNQPQRWLRAAT
jgi:hypothetical protein